MGYLPQAFVRSRFLPIRYVRARPRLFLSIFLGFVAYIFLPETGRLVTRLLISWNIATLFFLFSIGLMMVRSSPETIRRNAVLHDEGQYTILVLSSLAAIASLFAIIVQLGLVKESIGLFKTLHVGLAFVTILTAWAFIHVMFALHYAHEYFEEWRTNKSAEPQLRGGLDFIGDTGYPNYIDFAYFAFTIGVANATADINITSQKMRRIALVHSILSFFFNMALLGLTINIAASLI
ncbi:MAG: DUF1345 domain-containing protein [Alphaproteobacteria bacterium]|nr:DUF1345 domain-containing protein [Alphaproteobacteria bacterium]